MPKTPDGLLRIEHFSVDPNEHQLEPSDRAAASYTITNSSGHVELCDVVLTHVARSDNDGRPVLTVEPASVCIEGPIEPHGTRSVTVTLITNDHLPGRHPFSIEARFTCRPVQPATVAVFDYTVVSD